MKQADEVVLDEHDLARVEEYVRTMSVEDLEHMLQADARSARVLTWLSLAGLVACYGDTGYVWWAGSVHAADASSLWARFIVALVLTLVLTAVVSGWPRDRAIVLAALARVRLRGDQNSSTDSTQD